MIWDSVNCVLDIESELMCSLDISHEMMNDPTHWEKLCPFLTVNSDLSPDLLFKHQSNASGKQKYASTDNSIHLLGKALTDKGYFNITNLQLELPPLLKLLSFGVKRLNAYGYSQQFLMMYDEMWLISDLISSITTRASKNISIGDYYIFHVDPTSTTNRYVPGGPHRDRPMADSTSFRMEDDSPKYCSVWLALTDATTTNSCLYVLPKSDDEGYYKKGDQLNCDSSHLLFSHISAQPLLCGGLLCFSHRFAIHNTFF